ncbi:MAG: nodulation protein NfeD [Desulfobulbaceae bacterium]|nr:nodulation protein NfeD [Desulfobulbaceae bacterium]
MVWLTALTCGGLPALLQAAEPQAALMLDIKGAIGPAVSEYVRQGLRKAKTDNAAVVILRMDTPGGLDVAMREIIKDILSSTVPVATWVAPGGSRAASAGTYILYASHVAAMAPATNLGAATPIRIGGLPGAPKEPPSSEEPDEEKNSPDLVDTLQRKMVNDAAAYIRGLANRHGRNGDWAEKAVREAVSLTAEEALKIGVIDLMAATPEDLLQQMDGREAALESGKVLLATKDLTIVPLEPDWRNKLLSVITDPNIAYILLLVGIYGLIFELANPGAILPGVAGAVCLLLALYTFQILPINYAGLALIILGIIFMTAEAFVPSFGALGIGGVISFVVGSVILMDEESLSISLPLIGGTALVSAGFFIGMLGRLYTVSRKKVVTGAEDMVGGIGEAMEDFTGTGRVWIHGESWQAQCPSAVKKGRKVRVISKEGLQLKVETIEEEQ